MDTFQVLKWRCKAPMIPFSVPGRKIVHFACQDSIPTVWTECTDDHENPHKEPFGLAVYPTGYDIIDENISHVASCIDPGTGFVWHLYMDTRERYGYAQT